MIKADWHKLEAEVIAGDHGDEHDGEGHNSATIFKGDLGFGEGYMIRKDVGEAIHRVAGYYSDNTLEPGDKEGRIKPLVARQQGLVDKDHAD